MLQTPKNVFVIPDEELKDFYLKFAVFLNPTGRAVSRTELELLYILQRDLKKILAVLTHLNMHPWHEGIPELLTLLSTYTVQDNLSKKERIQMNTTIGQHLQFLTQMAADSHTQKRIYENYSFHYNNVEHIIKRMTKEATNIPTDIQ